MTKKEYKAVLIAMSGVRVYNKKLMQLGLTLPGFVDRSKVIASLPSLGLLTIAAHSPENWEIIYKELDEISETSITDILNEKPDLIAFSSLTARINETYALADKMRQANITVVIGGLHVSALPDEAMPHADSVIQGEGEINEINIHIDFAASAGLDRGVLLRNFGTMTYTEKKDGLYRKRRKIYKVDFP